MPVSIGYQSFSILDRNHDRAIGPGELSPAAITRLDTSGDGRVTEDELDAAVSQCPGTAPACSAVAVIPAASQSYTDGVNRAGRAGALSLTTGLIAGGIAIGPAAATAVTGIVLAVTVNPLFLLLILAALALVVLTGLVAGAIRKGVETKHGERQQEEAAKTIRKAWEDVAATTVVLAPPREIRMRSAQIASAVLAPAVRWPSRATLPRSSRESKSPAATPAES
jgi:MFS family permease